MCGRAGGAGRSGPALRRGSRERRPGPGAHGSWRRFPQPAGPGTTASLSVMRLILDRLGPQSHPSRPREEVHRYEGTVTQFLGDGILALFGAPITHEDHAQRAVRAALGIQQGLQEGRGILFRLRIGLNSGPVVVGTIGSDPNMTCTA